MKGPSCHRCDRSGNFPPKGFCPKCTILAKEGTVKYALDFYYDKIEKGRCPRCNSYLSESNSCEACSEHWSLLFKDEIEFKIEPESPQEEPQDGED